MKAWKRQLFLSTVLFSFFGLFLVRLFVLFSANELTKTLIKFCRSFRYCDSRLCIRSRSTRTSKSVLRFHFIFISSLFVVSRFPFWLLIIFCVVCRKFQMNALFWIMSFYFHRFFPLLFFFFFLVKISLCKTVVGRRANMRLGRPIICWNWRSERKVWFDLR